MRDIDTRRIVLTGGLIAGLNGAVNIVSPETASAQGRGPAPKESTPTQPNQPKTTPEALGFIALEVTTMGIVSVALLYGKPIIDRLKNRGRN